MLVFFSLTVFTDWLWNFYSVTCIHPLTIYFNSPIHTFLCIIPSGAGFTYCTVLPSCRAARAAKSECMLHPRAPLSGTFLQTLPDLVTPLKGHSLSPRSCPATRSAASETENSGTTVKKREKKESSVSIQTIVVLSVLV